MKIAVVENVLKLNDEVAAMNRRRLRDAGVFTIDLIGAPGCGKTAFIEATMKVMGETRRIGVIAGDLATQRDAWRMARWSSDIVQVNTGKGCHLEAHHVRQALENLELANLDLLFIENVGNLICPVGFDLGQDVKVGMFCVAGGDDKAAKHPYLVYESDLLLLNKVDLLPYVSFNRGQFREDIQKLNPAVEMIELSAASGAGMERWTDWLRSQCESEPVDHPVGRASASGGRPLADARGSFCRLVPGRNRAARKKRTV